MADNERNTEGMEISDEQLDAVSGGYILFNGKNWEIIDDDGNVVEVAGGYRERLEAKTRAWELGLDPADISWEELNDLRRRRGII